MRHYRRDDAACTQVLREDRGTLGPARRTDEGYLVLDAYLARAGVYAYRNPDGSITRELIDEDELFDQAWLDSLTMKPVTDDHPPGMVQPDSYKEYAVGTIGADLRADGDKLRGSLVVQDAAAITAINKGKRQVSCGYTCELHHTPGRHDTYGEYDAIQRKRRGNHAAIVDRGRHGEGVSVRADAAVMVRHDALPEFPEAPPVPTTPERPMIELIALLVSLGQTRADAEKVVGDALADAKIEAKADAKVEADATASATLAELQTKVDELEAQRDTLTTQAESLAKAVPSAADMMAYATERAAILAKADALGVEFEGGAHPELPVLKRLIVQKHLGDAFKADASDEYVAAAYDLAKPSAAKGDGAAFVIEQPEARQDAAPARILPGQAFRSGLTAQEA